MGLFGRNLTVARLPAGTWVDVRIMDHSLKLPNGDQFFWLEREPGNSTDANAVRVSSDAGWIGYLEAEGAGRYARILDLIPVPIRVSARVGFGAAVIGLAEPAALEGWVLRHRFKG